MVAGLGEAAAAVFFNRYGKLFRPKRLHGRVDVTFTMVKHYRISLNRFIADGSWFLVKALLFQQLPDFCETAATIP